MSRDTVPQAIEIIAPPDRYIPVAFQDIFEVIKGQMSLTDRDPFEEVCKVLECVSRMDFLENRRRLKQNFLLFSAGARKVQLITRQNKALPTKDDMDTRELNFMKDFLKVMSNAHYQLLKRYQWETALAEQYQFTLPMDIKWDALDSSLLRRLWESSEENKITRKDLPDIADKVLIFTRGIGQAKKSDMFINDKIDLLVEYLVAEPLAKLWHWILMKAGKAPPATEATNQQPSVAQSDTEIHKHAITVRRFSLKQQLPTSAAVLSKIAATIELQEPTFKEVVVLYRKVAAKPKSNVSVVGSKGTKDERLMNIMQKRNIHLKSFGEIAMADIELIFPEKNVLFKTVTLIQMGITIVLAIIAGITTLLEGAGWGIVMSAISVVGARFAQVYSSAQYTRALQINELSLMLYDRAQDSQEGMLAALIEGMMEQQQKEAVLALAKLSEKRTNPNSHLPGMTVQELDDACEQFLADEFNCHVDFAVENTLPYLQAWGLVQMHANRVVAVPMDQAKAALEQYWTKTFNRVGTKKSENGRSGLLSSFTFRRPPPMPPAPPVPSSPGLIPSGLAPLGTGMSPKKGSNAIHSGEFTHGVGLPPHPQSPYHGSVVNSVASADFDDDNVSVYSVSTGTKKKSKFRELFKRKKKTKDSGSVAGDLQSSP